MKAAYYDPYLGFFGPLVVVVVITAATEENILFENILFENFALSRDDNAERLFWKYLVSEHMLMD